MQLQPQRRARRAGVPSEPDLPAGLAAGAPRRGPGWSVDRSAGKATFSHTTSLPWLPPSPLALPAGGRGRGARRVIPGELTGGGEGISYPRYWGGGGGGWSAARRGDGGAGWVQVGVLRKGINPITSPDTGSSGSRGWQNPAPSHHALAPPPRSLWEQSTNHKVYILGVAGGLSNHTSTNGLLSTPSSPPGPRESRAKSFSTLKGKRANRL